MGQKLKYYIFK